MSQTAYQALKARVEATATRVGRAGQVRLVAVSKAQPDEKLVDALQDGCRLFGENYVQELEGKLSRLPTHPQVGPLMADVEWHFIGHLQTNKVRNILPHVRLIHSVDRESLIDALEKRAASLQLVQPILLEINLGGEESKSGCRIEQLPALVEQVLRNPHLELKGLMTLPPPVDDAERVRPYFRQLRQLRDDLQQRYAHPLPELSMGMSADFEVAIEEGATLVRVGTALFGTRSPRPASPSVSQEKA